MDRDFILCTIEDAQKEFEQGGEISNSAENLLAVADELSRSEFDSKKHKQKIQNFLNCCIMETQGNDLTHDDLAKLLEFYFNDEMYCEGLSCYQDEK